MTMAMAMAIQTKTNRLFSSSFSCLVLYSIVFVVTFLHKSSFVANKLCTCEWKAKIHVERKEEEEGNGQFLNILRIIERSFDDESQFHFILQRHFLSVDNK